MAPERKEFYVKLVERLGIASVVLAVVFWAIFELASWIGPRADRMIDTHVKVVESSVETSHKAMTIGETNSRTLQAMSEAQEKQTEILSDIHRAVAPNRFGLFGPKQDGQSGTN
jgi:hypothetical protein